MPQPLHLYQPRPNAGDRAALRHLLDRLPPPEDTPEDRLPAPEPDWLERCFAR